MAIQSHQFGFARPNVSRVARRQLSLSAALIAVVGFATLGAAIAVGGPVATTSAAKIEGEAPSPSFDAHRLATPVRPG